MKSFLFGLGMGLGLGALIAPGRGEATRKILRQRLERIFGLDVRSGEDDKQTTHDKTLADSFPTSDPPSSIPNPSEMSA